MKKVWFSLCVIALAMVSVGCHVLPPLPNVVQDMGPRYHPNNVYRRANCLSPDIRRVAVLPLSTPGSSAYFQNGVETLEPLLHAELQKCKRFEVMVVSPDQLRQWTGKKEWSAAEALPPNFFARVSEATGCDAILFSQLTRCEPYQPIAVGWKFSLVAIPPPGALTAEEMRARVIWSADEILDAGDPTVANAARDYYSSHLHNGTASAEASTILNSPTRFGQYTLAALLDTLPTRPPLTALK